jgi:hypothetical protein
MRIGPLLPPSTNDAYRGSVGAARLLAVLGVLTVVPGCIHTFLPDGGAATIAGLDLGGDRRLVVGLFAWAGATQIALGLVMVAVGLRYRPLVPLLLGVVLLERSLHLLNAWLLRPSGTGHHPPEHYAVLLGVPVLALAFVLSLRSYRSPAGVRHDPLDRAAPRTGRSVVKGGRR